MNPEQANDLMQRYAASKPGLGRSQLAERIVDEVMPKLVEALETMTFFADHPDFDGAPSDAAVAQARDALALARKP